MPYAVPTDLDEWAEDVEWTGGLPASDTPALEAWGEAEGGSFKNSAYGNVLNTTLTEPGSSSINSDGVQSFAISGDTAAQDWQTGIQADLATIDQTNMSAIKSSLVSGDPSSLPTALATDPWGTNPATVATILGESPSQIAALGSATSSSSPTTTAQLTSLNVNPFDLFGIPQTVAGDAASSLWGEIGPFIAKSILVVAGLGVMVLGVYKLTDLPQKLGADASKAAPLAELAAA
jgi:hypothetical protein